VRGWVRQTVGGLPMTFWYLWAATLVNRAGNFVIVFLALYLTAARHLSPSFVGLVVGLYGVGGAAGTLLGGVLADRWGRRPTLLLSYLSNAACVLGLGLARDRWAIAAGALLFGTAAEMARPAFAAFMVDVVPPHDRLRAFTLNYWAINLGFASASILAGLAAQASYVLLFAGDAATTLLTALIVLTKVREVARPPAAPPDGPSRERHHGEGLRTAFTDRVFIAFVGLNLLTALVFMQHTSGLPIAMARDGLSPATFGAVIALNGVLIVLGQLFVPRIVGGRDRSRVLAVAAIVFGTGFGLTAFAHTPLAYAATVLVWTLGEMLNSPSNSTLLADLSPARLRGRYQGVFSLSWQGAAALTPVLGGLVQQHLGTRWLWLGCGAIGAVVAVAQALSGPARERRTAELRTVEAPVAREPVSV
jgi:MFS family permease